MMRKSQIEEIVFELDGPRDLVERRQTIDLGAVEKNSVVARTLVSAISPGTEIAAYIGTPPLRPGKVYPRLVGYCSVAEIIAVGSDVADIGEGDYITTSQAHRSAFVCPESEVMAVVPKDADVGAAATTYLFHLGYNALLVGGMRLGHSVGVIGLGTLGLTTIAVASQAGAQTFGFSNQDGIAERGRHFGAREVFGRRDSGASSRIDHLTGGTGIDLVVTTSNSWEDWRFAMELVRPGGTIAVLGFPGRDGDPPPINPLDSQFLYDKQLTIIGCNSTPDCDLTAKDIRFTLRRNYHHLLNLVIRGDLPARSLISETVPWNRLGEVYERLAAREPGLLTCLLDWR